MTNQKENKNHIGFMECARWLALLCVLKTKQKQNRNKTKKSFANLSNHRAKNLINCDKQVIISVL